jgi:protein-L-isoaspartate(D-aspartate) O-methyltransferase
MENYQDTYRHKGLRKKMVDGLREKGITDERVLQAINNVPRHCFLDSAFDEIAYEDRSFSIGEGQTISHPYTVAYQSQLLDIKAFDKVLEVGTGSIYQATILAEMGAYVYTIERQKALYEQTKKYIYKTKYPQLKFFFGDGFEGLPTYGPFDKVIITAGAPFIPPKLLDQLKPGGVMVLPLTEGDQERMYRITKKEDGTYKEEAFDQFSFVPMLTGKRWINS